MLCLELPSKKLEYPNRKTRPQGEALEVESTHEGQSHGRTPEAQILSLAAH